VPEIHKNPCISVCVWYHYQKLIEQGSVTSAIETAAETKLKEPGDGGGNGNLGAIMFMRKELL